MSECAFCDAGNCIWHLSPTQKLQMTARTRLTKLAAAKGKRGASVGGLGAVGNDHPPTIRPGGVAARQTPNPCRSSFTVPDLIAGGGLAPVDWTALSTHALFLGFGWLLGLLTGLVLEAIFR